MSKTKVIHSMEMNEDQESMVDAVRSFMRCKSDIAFDRFLEMQRALECKETRECLEIIEGSDYFREFACEIFMKGFLEGRGIE